jgi:hypothetical protein
VAKKVSKIGTIKIPPPTPRRPLSIPTRRPARPNFNFSIFPRLTFIDLIKTYKKILAIINARK